MIFDQREKIIYNFIVALTYEILFRVIKNTVFVQTIINIPIVSTVCKYIVFASPLLLL